MGWTTGRTSRTPDDAAAKNAFRLRVALVMAAVSLASAYVTFVAADRSAEASDLDAVASQQWAEEQQADQQIDAEIAQDQTLTARLDIAQNAYTRTLAEAERVMASDLGEAAALLRDIQETNALYVQFLPFFRADIPQVADDGLTYDAAAAENVLRVQDPRLYRSSSELTRTQAAAAADLSSRTGATIVLLVASLFILTLAHIMGPRRGTPLAWIGGAVALAGVVWFSVLGIASAVPLIAGAVLTAGILIAARVPRIRAWLTGLETVDPSPDGVADRPGAMADADPSTAPSTVFDRTVVVVIALATLLGAGVGFLHSQASRMAEQYAWSANDDGVASIGTLRSAEGALGVQLSDFQEALAQRVASWNATQRALSAEAAGDAAAAAEHTLVAAEAATAAARLEERSGLSDAMETTGIAGLDRLTALRASVWEDTARTIGEQDAANAASRSWGERAGWYLAVLAWLAVAVYLLGLSLVFKDGRARFVLATIGMLLVVGAIGQSVRAFTAPPPVSAERASAAAQAYADGVVALQRNKAGEAETAFTQALDLRPDFGIAARERATAILTSGSAEGLGLRSGFTDAAVTKAIADLESARRHGADTAGVMLNLGAMLVHRAINTGSMADMRASLEASRSGLALAEDAGASQEHPHINAIIGRFNMALALLGVGDEDAALTEYTAAGAQIHTLPPYLRPYLVSTGLATVDLLDRGPAPATDEQRKTMKQAVVTAAYADDASAAAAAAAAAAAGTVTVDAVTVEVFPAQVQWRATITGFDPAHDRMAVQWYRLDHGIGEWGAVPVLSGPLTYERVDAGGQFFRDPTGTYWGNSSATLVYDVPPSCIRPGTYRVELYVNGELAGSAKADSPSEQPDYKPVLARDVGFAMCGLTGWKQVGRDGISRGFESSDGQRSITVHRVQQAITPGIDVRSAAIERLLRAGDGGVSPGAQEIDRTGESHPAVFGGAPALWRIFRSGDEVTVYAAVRLASGAVLVARVSGPAAWTDGTEAWQLLGSTALTPQ
jgi:hypothetical protein